MAKLAEATSTLTRTVADYAVSTSFADLPEAVREQTRMIVIDELACACFGARTVAGSLMSGYVSSVGGRPESTILGSGAKAPAAMAALANGTSGHGEEVDGAHLVGGHPGATVVAAAIAIAERQRASGEELLNAVALGYDIGTRAVQACGGVFSVRSRFKLHSDFLFGLGAASASSRLLGLDSSRHRYALALATFQINGLDSLFQEKRHLSKSFSNGQYAGAGVQAALMSAAGFEGSEDILGSPGGVLDAWGIDDGTTTMQEGLGVEFSVMSANFKFVNAGYPIHAALEAAVTLARENDLVPAGIRSVTIGMPANALKVVDNRAMHNICVQDMVTAALVLGGIGIRVTPFPEVLANPHYALLRRLVIAEVDIELSRIQPNGRGARVTIVTSDGRTYSERVDAPRGHTDRGSIVWTDLAEKWRDGLPDRDVERLVQFGRDLHELDDVTLLTEAFRPIR